MSQTLPSALLKFIIPDPVRLSGLRPPQHIAGSLYVPQRTERCECFFGLYAARDIEGPDRWVPDQELRALAKDIIELISPDSAR